MTENHGDPPLIVVTCGGATTNDDCLLYPLFFIIFFYNLFLSYSFAMAENLSFPIVCIFLVELGLSLGLKR